MAAGSNPAPDLMKKFEYQTISPKYSMTAVANEQGQKGWELVSVLMPGYEYGPYTMFFKRELTPAPEIPAHLVKALKLGRHMFHESIDMVGRCSKCDLLHVDSIHL